MSALTVLSFFSVYPAVVAHSGPNSTAYLYVPDSSHLYTGHVGAELPEAWEVWSVLPSWTLTHEGRAADRAWDDLLSRGAAK